MEKIIKLKMPKEGFQINEAFINTLVKKLESKKDRKDLIGFIVSESIDLFLEKYVEKE